MLRRFCTLLSGFDRPQAVALVFGEDQVVDFRLDRNRAPAGRRSADSDVPADRQRPHRASSRLPCACGSCASSSRLSGSIFAFAASGAAALLIHARQSRSGGRSPSRSSPCSTNSAASQSSSSWFDGRSPITPKSLGVRTMPVPIRNCQMRFTITRAVSGFSGDASQFASAVRRPVRRLRESRKPPCITRGTAGSTGSRRIVRIAHPQHVSSAAPARRYSRTRRPSAADRARSASISCKSRAQLRPLRPILRRHRRHHLVPGRLDLLLGVLAPASSAPACACLRECSSASCSFGSSFASRSAISRSA